MYSHTKHRGIVFQIMDNGGPTDDREAYIEDAAAEINRSKSLCHKANMTDPTDLSYRTYLEELLQRKLDDVTILTPFYCDMGIRVSLGHKVFTYHKVTIGKNVWICTNATICPGVTPFDLWELELMDKLDIDWQPYRKGASKKPELPIERLKEKLAKEKG